MNNNNIPQIQESTLIELREDDSIKSKSEQNGEYTIHLQEPLTIKEGESIALKSGFVDSVAENSGMKAWGGNGIGYAASGSGRGAPWSSNL